MNEAIKMQLSAFVDGELPDNEAELLLRRLSQDDELRQQVSEYLVVGRVMRGEPTIAGMDTLRDRISASLDDSDFVTDLDDVEIPTQGFARPLTGVAVAATVAVIALLGVSQFNTPDGPAEPGQPSVAITQPEPDALLDQYRQSHGDISEAERSAVAIGDRLRNVDVTLPAGSDLVEIPAAEPDAEAESSEDDEAEALTDTAAE